MSSPLVSVILPTRNSKYLQNAVQSILNQTLDDFELIIISNSEFEKFREITFQLQTLDSRIRILEEPQKGVVFAANTGIHNAKGKFIARMDADDISLSNRLKCQADFLDNNSEIDIVSGLVEYGGNAENKGFIRYVDWLNKVRTADEIALNQFVEFPLVNPSMMFRKEIIQKTGLFEEGDFPEDYEFFLRAISLGIKISKTEDLVIRWSDYPNRLTRTDERYSFDSFFRIKAKYLAVWLKQNNPFHPKITVWGAGRLSRRRSDYLKKYGIEIEKYIDFKENLTSKVIDYKAIRNDCFVVSYVSNWDAREEIRDFLIQKGFQEGRTFILAG